MSKTKNKDSKKQQSNFYEQREFGKKPKKIKNTRPRKSDLENYEDFDLNDDEE
ncbi:hypothetical protein V2E24_00390 [Mycoplasmopsis ciconiae]|uniref:Uncharacterized protein n=1 Tax=Mycoplasmopsis ciconiae TaxID=561067 RepID=A0ABU7MLW3_9BACT|nr:hypothetical protein [Mycoplasmopsis ciconiae]